MFFLFLILIIGPIIANKFVGTSIESLNIGGSLGLMQPNNWNNNDTTNKATGTAEAGKGGSAATASGGAAAQSSSIYKRNSPVFVYGM